MFLTNEKYEITIIEAPHYSANSMDNKSYDMCISVLEEDRYIRYSSHELEVLSSESAENFSIILISSYCTNVLQNSGILEENIFGCYLTIQY